MMKNILEKIVEKIKTLPEIESIALSGSKTNNFSDEQSDFDIYVYSSNKIDVDFRKKLAQSFSDRFEVNNNYWENGDEWVAKSGETIDIMYRSCSFIEENISQVFENFNAQVGYSTCILFNVQKSKILFDRNGWFKKQQEKINTEYPQKLSKAIIEKNLPLLRNNISSYKAQIIKALDRNDLISVNHRITAFLASYFDILFALNKVFHPGEKRLLEFANELDPVNKPKKLNKNIEKLLNAKDKLTLLEKIDELVDSLEILPGNLN